MEIFSLESKFGLGDSLTRELIKRVVCVGALGLMATSHSGLAAKGSELHWALN